MINLVHKTNGKTKQVANMEIAQDFLDADYVVVTENSGTTVNPAKGKLKGANARHQLNDEAFRNRAAQITAYNLNNAVGAVPEIIAAQYPVESLPEGDGVEIATFQCSAVEAIEKEKKGKPGEIWFALKIKGELNGATWTTNVLMPRSIPQPNDMLTVGLITRSQNQSGITFNIVG